MPQLRDERAAVWDADGPAAGHAVEEEALDRVVVQGTVDVDGPDGCPIQALRVQINLASQLLLVPGVRVAWVHLGERQHARGAVDAGAAHEDELLAAAGGHDRLDQRLDFLELAGIVVVDDVEPAAGAGDGGVDGCRVLAVGNEHSDALQHFLVVGVAHAGQGLWLAAVGLAAVEDEDLVAGVPELLHQVAADEARAAHDQDLLGGAAPSGHADPRATRRLRAAGGALGRAAGAALGRRADRRQGHAARCEGHHCSAAVGCGELNCADGGLRGCRGGGSAQASGRSLAAARGREGVQAMPGHLDGTARGQCLDDVPRAGHAGGRTGGEPRTRGRAAALEPNQA
mmetsp:Transcript_80667/g.260702  ORF Transcript_80667/g.260702 Transcript_80667/m.260702 type:complete len:343 (+) Transcript_80667:614-1642(+)